MAPRVRTEESALHAVERDVYDRHEDLPQQQMVGGVEMADRTDGETPIVGRVRACATWGCFGNGKMVCQRKAAKWAYTVMPLTPPGDAS